MNRPTPSAADIANGFTPGTWRVQEPRGNRHVRVVAGELAIGVARINAGLHTTANAHLIAAAKGLFFALNAVIDSRPPSKLTRAEARAWKAAAVAIAKAQGK